MLVKAFLSSDDFIQKKLFLGKNLSVISSKCQTVWIKILPDALSGLIWVPAVIGSRKRVHT